MDYQLLINRAKQLGFTDIEVYVNTNRALAIEIFNGNVEKNEFSATSNFSVRAIYNNKMAYLSFENENEDIEYILNTLKKNAESITTEEEFMIYPGDSEYPQVPEVKRDFDKYTVFDKIELLKTLEKQIKDSDSRIVQVASCSFHEYETSVKIVNSLGLDVKKDNAFCYIIAQVVASENNQTQSEYTLTVKKQISELNLEEICKEVVDKTVSMLNAKPVKSQAYPVIIENETMANLLNAFESVFSGEAALKKITPLIDKIDTKIMSEMITIVDDPLLEASVFKDPFDDEGVASYRKNVVEAGVFKGFLHNLKTAKYFNTKSTGNGTRGGGVSSTNLFIEPGTKTKEQLIESIDKGLLLTSLEGMHAGVNPISGDFSLKTSGYLIENGKIIRPVTLIVAAGNFFNLMNNVEAVANDLKIRYNGIGSPSIKFTTLAISGE